MHYVTKGGILRYFLYLKHLKEQPAWLVCATPYLGQESERLFEPLVEKIHLAEDDREIESETESGELRNLIPID